MIGTPFPSSQKCPMFFKYFLPLPVTLDLIHNQFVVLQMITYVTLSNPSMTCVLPFVISLSFRSFIRKMFDRHPICYRTPSEKKKDIDMIEFIM